jgi:FlaA1/EpsC-like NDP-sugar epimerase
VANGARDDGVAPARRLGVALARSAARMRGDSVLVFIDVVFVVAAYVGLLFARFDGRVPSPVLHRLTGFLITAVLVEIAFTWVWGCYGRTWRHASVDEARRLVLAGACSALVLVTVSRVIGWGRMPLTVVLAGPMLVAFLQGVARFQERLFAFRRSGDREEGLRVAVIGGGSAGEAAIRAMQQHRNLGLRPVVILDDERAMHHRSIHGVPIAGSIDALADVARDFGVHQALLAIGAPRRDLVSRVADGAARADVPVRVLPHVSAWMQGLPPLRDVRDLRIEDLLGRQQVDLDLSEVHAMLDDRRVLVTGAGGWIGSEILRQLLLFAPREVVALDHDETHLHDAVSGLDGRVRSLLADVRDSLVVDEVFLQTRPEIVFHAAAHKHVPILEDFACEAIRTNILGTRHVVDAAVRTGTDAFVLISTDKAATPTSVMGASKWLAERVLLDIAADHRSYRAVRFGNVLGSRGSVVPTFQRQIAAGGPVTVTDSRMTRYFMSTTEAVSLVLKAAAIDGTQHLVALEMGEQINIAELAARMIRLSGLEPDVDIEVRVIGARPGERLSESIAGSGELVRQLDDSIVALEPVRLAHADLETLLARMVHLADTNDHQAARTALLQAATSSPTVASGHARSVRSVTL